MWQEFPKDTNTFDLSVQFMFGDKILAAPKINDTDFYSNFFGFEESEVYPIKLYLPESEKWYYYYTKQVEATKGFVKDRRIKHKEQGIFVKGGSIIPIKLHNFKLNLLRAFIMPIRLDVYLDQHLKASGLLYLDDGESFRYKTHKEKTLI